MFQAVIEKYNLPKFRLKQLNQSYYYDLVDDFDDMTTLPKDLRTKLAAEVELRHLSIIKTLESAKKDTVKFLFQSNSGKVFETVLMMHQDNRNTVCVSCMQGCPVGCTFCATGKIGYKGNLTAEEIVDQVLFSARYLKDNHPNRLEISNVVFMGMGEPMLNFDNVWEAYKTLTDPEKFGLGKRKVTISTSGYVQGIHKLIELGYKGRLAISLHAPNQTLREQIMPNVAKSNKMDELIAVLDEFASVTNKRITYEYILIKNLTDTESCARELTRLFQRRLAHFNLIPYNPVEGVDYERPEKSDVLKFASLLEKSNIPHTIRVTMGDDIKAACGQLAGSKS